MKILGLNNREYKLNFQKYKVKNDSEVKKSKYHLLARNLIKEIYGNYLLLEEVKLPGIKEPGVKSSLFLDFLLPSVMIGVEVHGQQHYEYSHFFHKTKIGFYNSKRRDVLKQEWCDLNSIELIHLKYSDTKEEWTKQLARS